MSRIIKDKRKGGKCSKSTEGRRKGEWEGMNKKRHPKKWKQRKGEKRNDGGMFFLKVNVLPGSN